MAVSMDNSSEDFWVQYYDGSTWHTVASYARSIDFDNNVFYNKVVTIPKGTYNYPTNAQLRFMCDASGNYDDVYIDEIEFRGLTGGGSSSGPDIADKEPEVPAQFTLHQNYPNPFNPVTIIRFTLEREGLATLEIFNVAGQRVAILVNNVLPADTHEIEWNAAGNTSGVYFYRLTQGTKSVMKKMVLLR
ncbi:MAG: T9SS type A sorting domain-containing protein [bacterium]|nr:MAG: T9SS type A sorting domain-containing protein [bacterium]